MITPAVNPWGRTDGFEAQRHDLWSLDLNPVAQLVRDHPGVAPTGEYLSHLERLPPAWQPDFYVQRVQLPELTIANLAVVRDTQKVALPGYDQAPGVLRVNCLHETTNWNGATPGVSSAIYSLFYCWQLLAQAGQTRYSRSILPLVTAESKPKYAVTLKLALLRGTEGDEPLALGAYYLLDDAWVSDLQLMDLDMAEATPLQVVATLQIRAMRPAAF